jgi:hypothetical protein
VSAQPPRTYLIECYWPGVTLPALAETVTRADAAASQLRRQGHQVELTATILVPTDETVFCIFKGEEADVRAAGELAGMRLGRVLESLWVKPGGAHSLHAALHSKQAGRGGSP